MEEYMKVPGVLGNSPTGRHPGTTVEAAGWPGDANDRMRNAEAKAKIQNELESERNARDRQAYENKNKPRTEVSTPKPRTHPDGRPILPGDSLLPPMHSAVAANKRQFGSVGSALKGTLSRVRTASRLKGFLRRGR
jgi:hypothetical protein